MLAAAVEHYNRENRQEEKRIQILAEIAHWRQRAENADKLFQNARISETDWHKLLETAEHEIERLKLQIANHDEAEIGVQVTTKMVADFVQNWKDGNLETRRALPYGVFQYLIYDLDKQQVVDFKLKPWLERVMQLKLTLEDYYSDLTPDSGSSSDGKPGIVGCSRRAMKPHHVTRWGRLLQSCSECSTRINRHSINQLVV
jgi:hypothetical protein